MYISQAYRYYSKAHTITSVSMLLLGQVCCYPYRVSHTICHKLVYLPQESRHTTGPNVQQKNFRYRKTYYLTSHTDAPPGQHNSESPYICLSITLVSIIMDVSKHQITSIVHAISYKLMVLLLVGFVCIQQLSKDRSRPA